MEDLPSKAVRIASQCPTTTWRMRELHQRSDLRRLWNQVDMLTYPMQKKSPYIVGFACSDACVEAALRLRYEVFNVELKSGLAESHMTGMDRDAFDDQMTHLVVLEKQTGRMVGTYRFQRAVTALEHRGLYSEGEFDTSALEPYLPSAMELGRACTAADHRHASALLTLWFGLQVYINLFDVRYLFGCCSIMSADPDDGWRAMKTLRTGNHLHPQLMLDTCSRCSCGDPSRERDADLGEAITLPKLFRTYLRLGAKVISRPCIDREFGSIDFLILMDMMDLKTQSVTASKLR